MAGPGDTPQIQSEASVKLEEPDFSSANWYFSREEVEKYGPSRKDGVDLKKETYYRKSYCTFLQDLGMRLKVPQVTIATAIVFCHRFFLRQSHARNDRHMVATICMFLAGKVEETPRHLEDVIKVSYVCRHKKDPAAAQRIKQKEVFLQQKELILAGERLVLATLGFDLNIHHPYKPLVAAIKKFKVSQHALAQVAWNFVNDGLRTSLCLQFKPHHIAAGAIFLAAKFLKVKLPCDGERVWWQEFEVTPRQLEEVSNQMLELYEQNRPAPPPSSSDPSASADPKDVGNQSAAPPSSNGQVSSQTEQPEDDRHVETARPQMEDSKKTSAMSEEMVLSPSVNGSVKKEQEVPVSPTKGAIAIPVDSANGAEMTTVVATSSNATDKQDWGTIDEVNKDKLKAALEKRRKSRVECGDVKSVSQKQEATDEELLERELENGVEVAAEAERARQEGNVTDDTKVKQVKLENGQRKDDRGRPESENTLKDSKRGHPLTTGKRERSDELPATGKRERSDELPTTIKRERSDELPTTVKRERSDELPATVKRERSDELPTTVKRERTDELDPAAKRKRLNDEGYADKKSTREAVDAKPFDDRAEEGELPPSAAQEQSRSPRNGNERRASPPYDRRRDYGGRDQQPYPARREAFYDANKHRDSGYRHRDYYHHHPHHQYQQPHRDVEWHRPREAWIERDAKKMRYDHGK